MNNNQKLRALIKKHGLTRPEVRELACVKKSTVDSWLAPSEKAWFRPLDDGKLELIQMKLKGRGNATKKT
jgi:hypothetical protein